jgi:hypothetical protein
VALAEEGPGTRNESIEKRDDGLTTLNLLGRHFRTRGTVAHDDSTVLKAA